MKSNVADSKILILHDIRSAQNVGALFRTADAVRIDRIYLSSICPLPIDRFGRPRSDIAKTALGAEKNIAWEAYTDITVLLQTLQNQGVHVIAIEQSPKSVDYKNVVVKTPVAFILGNEVEGVPREVLAQCDVVAEIPMEGSKESLNVSVAAGVALFRMLNI
ncbi:MAG: TrmH family RNA methyltransferase [Candidatus Pacebacteria bacterium]|nr:TrmH family RNA methyltransferase [Candidatus Paceibacterota bacterium]MBP9701080.1 TrmH family RNA methyltransferase [Candidatus Paceibacterota bacterium]